MTQTKTERECEKGGNMENLTSTDKDQREARDRRILASGSCHLCHAVTLKLAIESGSAYCIPCWKREQRRRYGIRYL